MSQQEPKEYVKVKLERWKWEHIREHCHLDSNDFVITDVQIYDGLFDNDEAHKALYKASKEAYKKLITYEQKVRHGK